MPVFSDSTRMDLRQKLGAHTANHLIEAIETIAGASGVSPLSGLAADVSYLKSAEAKHDATVEALVQSNIGLRKEIAQLRKLATPVEEELVIKTPVMDTPPADLVVPPLDPPADPVPPAEEAAPAA